MNPADSAEYVAFEEWLRKGQAEGWVAGEPLCGSHDVVAEDDDECIPVLRLTKGLL